MSCVDSPHFINLRHPGTLRRANYRRPCMPCRPVLVHVLGIPPHHVHLPIALNTAFRRALFAETDTWVPS